MQQNDSLVGGYSEPTFVNLIAPPALTVPASFLFQTSRTARPFPPCLKYGGSLLTATLYSTSSASPWLTSSTASPGPASALETSLTQTCSPEVQELALQPAWRGARNPR